MDLKKMWMSSLSFLEHNLLYSIILFIIVLYTLGIFRGINMFIGSLYNMFIVRLLVIILIIWVTPKDPTLGILLALSYAVSLYHMDSNENFVAKTTQHQPLHNQLNKLSNQQQPKQKPIQYQPIQQQIKHEQQKQQHSTNKVKEHFFPFTDDNQQTQNNNIIMNSNNSCMDMYVPEHEAISNVCDSVSTFQGQLNTQGLNSPLGFDSNVSGSPI